MKTILVPVERHALIDSVLETAHALAVTFDSYVEGFALTHDFSPFVPADTFSATAVYSADPGRDDETARACRTLFEDFMRARGVPATRGEAAIRGTATGLAYGWTEAGSNAGDSFAGTYGRVFDIVVVGRPGGDDDAPRMGTLEAALFETGRPILIAPPSPTATLGENILIAWNGSPETARTVAFAKPLLRRARHVTVLALEGGTTPGPTGEQLGRHLLMNGLPCEVRHVRPGADARGPAILEEAGARGCDLVIKGAYTQSRLRQMIFGGATRHIIAETTLPVLMAH